MRQIDIYTNYLYTCKINIYIYDYICMWKYHILACIFVPPKIEHSKKRWFLKLAPFNYGCVGVSM